MGLFGGTFNPPHRGHLLAARTALRRLGLERVIFIPAGYPVHKPGSGLPSASARLTMVRLAAGSNRRFSVSDAEIRRRGPSYAIDTVRYFRRKFPRREIFFIIGADSVRDIKTWHRWRELVRTVRFAIVARPGFRLEPVAGCASSCALLRTRGSRASSRVIRNRLEREGSLSPALPPGVAGYIRRKKLYSRSRARARV